MAATSNKHHSISGTTFFHRCAVKLEEAFSHSAEFNNIFIFTYMKSTVNGSNVVDRMR